MGLEFHAGRCGCPDEWLADHPSEAHDRRVAGDPAVGDYHTMPDGDLHVWDGYRWFRQPTVPVTPAPQQVVQEEGVVTHRLRSTLQGPVAHRASGETARERARKVARGAVGENVILDHWWLDDVIEKAADAASGEWETVVAGILASAEAEQEGSHDRLELIARLAREALDG